jgi:Cu2+-exporting ATPase
LLRVKPGEKFLLTEKLPMGNYYRRIDGEPIPLDKKSRRCSVIAGTINGNKSFVMVAEKIGSETLLSQIVQMVNSASRSRADTKLADRIAKYFVPIVVAVSIITFVWAKFGPEPAIVYGFLMRLPF